MNWWISVEDALPLQRFLCWVFHVDHTHLATYWRQDRRWHTADGSEMRDVTHWQRAKLALPNPPLKDADAKT